MHVNSIDTLAVKWKELPIQNKGLLFILNARDPATQKQALTRNEAGQMPIGMRNNVKLYIPTCICINRAWCKFVQA